MVNMPSAIYWDVDGVSLQTFAQNIATLGGSRWGVPPLRGSNIQVPGRPGALWQSKIPDSRTLTLAMWVRGTDTNGNVTGDRQKKFTENWRALQQLFWKPDGAQISLTKRWDDGTGVKSATALAEFAGGLEPSMIGPNAAKFTVDLLLADPFFYGAQVTSTLAVGVGQVVNNAGDVPVGGYGMSLKFNGALTNPQVTNSSISPNIWAKWTGSISGGDSITLDVAEFTALKQSDSTNQIGGVTYNPGPHGEWFYLAKGNNTLTLTASAGTGTCTFKHRPAYL